MSNSAQLKGGALYVVATPIGNLGDLSIRASEILRSVPVVAAEDTRVTMKLLARIKARPRLVSFHESSPSGRLMEIVGALESGDVALVTDAGTPALSDPGADLVSAAVGAGHQVVAVPGPSAITAALSVGGMPAGRFLYLGFLPRPQKRRVELLQSVSDEPGLLVALEAPHRMRRTLEDIAGLFPDRNIAVCRELTKLHEEIYRGTAAGALEYFVKPRGEFIMVIEGSGGVDRRLADDELLADIRSARSRGLAGRDLVQAVATSTKAPRSRIYRLALEERRDSERRG